MPKSNPKAKVKRRRALFRLEAPEAREVILTGDFKNWNTEAHPMKKNRHGVWEKTMMLPAGRYEYKFLIDGRWRNDPKNQDICHNCFGTFNNVLIVCE